MVNCEFKTTCSCWLPDCHCKDDTRPHPAPSIFDDEILKESALVFKQLAQPEKTQCPYSSDDDMCLECTAHEERIARKAREDVLKECCSQCPVREEEMPIEDHYAESCEGCLVHKVCTTPQSEQEQPR